MPDFYFCIDTKVTTWERDKYKITRDNEEEAIEFMKKHFNGEIELENKPMPYFSDDIDDSRDHVSPTIDSPEKTKELILILGNGFDVPICDNAIPPIQNPHV